MTRVLGFDPSSDQASLGIATASSPTRAWPGQSRPWCGWPGQPQVVASPAGGAPASISVFPALGPLGGLTFDMPGQSAAFTSSSLSSPVQVTGSPTVRVRVSGAPEVTLFAKVYDVDQAGNATLPNQLVSPVRGHRGAGRGCHHRTARDRPRLLHRAPAPARADHDRLRLRHRVAARDLPGSAGRPGSDHAVRPGPDRRQRRGALVGMGGASRGAGGRRAHPGPRPPPQPRRRRARTRRRPAGDHRADQAVPGRPARRRSTCRCGWNAGRSSACSGPTERARPPPCAP